jgi:periplasmic protein TonB
MARQAQRTSSDASRRDEGAEFLAFALEDERDSRRTRVAIVAALLFHALLFMAPLGFLAPKTAVAEPPRPKVFLVQPVRFKQPPPGPQRELPPPRTRRVPIPDPTPDEPEPLRLDESIPQDIETPDTDLVAALPVGPPPLPNDGPRPVGGDVLRPLKVSGPTPLYTEIARRARIEGVVIVEAIIDQRGEVTNVRVLKSLPLGLDQAAVDAVSQWRFEPATLNGKPVAVYYTLTVNFRLQR